MLAWAATRQAESVADREIAIKKQSAAWLIFETIFPHLDDCNVIYRGQAIGDTPNGLGFLSGSKRFDGAREDGSASSKISGIWKDGCLFGLGSFERSTRYVSYSGEDGVYWTEDTSRTEFFGEMRGADRAGFGINLDIDKGVGWYNYYYRCTIKRGYYTSDGSSLLARIFAGSDGAEGNSVWRCNLGNHAPESHPAELLRKLSVFSKDEERFLAEAWQELSLWHPGL